MEPDPHGTGADAVGGKTAHLVNGDGDATPPMLHLRRPRPGRYYLADETDPAPVGAGLQLQGGPARYLKRHEAGLSFTSSASVRRLAGGVRHQLGELCVDKSPDEGVSGCLQDARRNGLSDRGGYTKTGEDHLVAHRGAFGVLIQYIQSHVSILTR